MVSSPFPVRSSTAPRAPSSWASLPASGERTSTRSRAVIAEFAARNSTQAVAARTQLEALTDREREVAVAVAQGLSNAEIAKLLFMSEATVKAHVSHVLAKLNLTNRVQAAMLVHDAGLTGP